MIEVNSSQIPNIWAAPRGAAQLSPRYWGLFTQWDQLTNKNHKKYIDVYSYVDKNLDFRLSIP